jgi:hypothetical protein
MPGRAAAAGFCGVLLISAPAQADYFGTPSIAATMVDDDNLFFAPHDAQHDRIRRLSPGLETGYESAPLSWRATLSVDAEAYERQPEHDSSHAREHAALDYWHRPARRWTLALNASHTKTQTPGELTPDTGLDFARQRAERFAVAPSLAHQLDRRTLGFLSYGFTRDALEGAAGSDSDSHVLGAGFSRRTSQRDTASIEYRHRRLDAGAETHASHAVLGGVTRRFTERTSGTLAAGPRFANGAIELEGAASLRHALQRGELSLEYARTETTVLGLAGAATTQSLGASASAFVGPSLEWRVASGVLATEHGGRRVDVIVLDLHLGLRLTRTVSAFAAYGHRTQRGQLETAGSDPIARNVAMLGLVVRPATEAREAARRSRTRMPTAREPWGAGQGEADEEETP